MEELPPEVVEQLSAANAAAAAAQQRATEIRAEAAMLVESVEDRAHEAIQEAQAQKDSAVREVEQLRAELQRIRGRGGQ